MTCVLEILNGLPGVGKPQRKFLDLLFSTLMVVRSTINFVSLSRQANFSERSFRRQFRRRFDFPAFNRQVAVKAACQSLCAVACDASFIKKSGRCTEGLGKFWNGTAQRTEKGLEVSLIALVEPEKKRAFAISAEQTPAGQTAGEGRETRIDFYLAHFLRTVSVLPESVRFVLVDSYYAKQKFVSGVCQAGYEIVSRLRSDANLRYLYEGPQKERGRPRKYDGKVELADLSRLTQIESEEPRFTISTKKVWAVSLKRELQILVLVARKQKKKTKPIVLFTTDLLMEPEEILKLYRSRFQIEFLFRDAKQSAGLSSCQARDRAALEFHWNAAFACLNVARLKDYEEQAEAEKTGFSMKSLKQRAANEHLLELFISKLELDPTLIKKHKDYDKLRNYAVISP